MRYPLSSLLFVISLFSFNALAQTQYPPVGVEMRLEKISEQILKMPLKRRQILVMNRFEHLSYAEISRKIGITEAAVRKHIKRALQDINLDLLNNQ